MKDPKPTTGYAFKYSGKSWEKSKSDSWDIAMISASDVSKAKYVPFSRSERRTSRKSRSNRV